MEKYFAVLTLDGLEEVKRRDGYAAAMRRLEELRRAIEARCPEAEYARASRTGVEFLFQAADRTAAEALLSKVAAMIVPRAWDEGNGLPSRTVAAVAFVGDLSDSVVVEANAAMARALRERRPVLVAGARLPPASADDLIDDLAAAMHGNGLALHYQPKIHCRTNETAGVEALLRWNHPALGAISPELFIPAAERSGLIGELTSWVIRRSVSDQGWLRAAGLDIPIHVNISAPMIADSAFVDEVLGELRAGTATLGFEITETAMMADPEGTLANLHRLASAGIHLAIDDYGSGFSSLAYLQRLPVQELKIDKVFISRLSQGSRDPLLVRSTIDLAHALEMEVTAEGVESAAAFALLQVMRCDLVQGYFLSPALPIGELLHFVRRGGPLTEATKPASLRDKLAQRRSGRETAA